MSNTGSSMPKERKNPAAVALGKLSAASMTPEQRAAHGRMGGKIGGKIGGKRRAATLTAAQRSKIAKKAAEARWAQAKNER
jgi:hypothetical protein